MPLGAICAEHEERDVIIRAQIGPIHKLAQHPAVILFADAIYMEVDNQARVTPLLDVMCYSVGTVRVDFIHRVSQTSVAQLGEDTSIATRFLYAEYGWLM